MSVLKGSPRAIISIIALAMMVITPAAFATGTSQDDHKSSCGGKHESSSKSYSSSNDKCKPPVKDDKCDDDHDGHGGTYSKSYSSPSFHKDDNDCKSHKPPVKDDDCDDNKYGKSYGSPSHKDDDDCVKPPPPPVDVCKNIAGNQPTVPTGMVKDSAGNCATPPVKPPVPPVVPPAPPVVLSTPPAPAQPAVVPPTLISVHKVALKPAVKVGGKIDWRIVVRNDSNKAVTVTVKDTLPGALALSNVPSGANLKNGTLTFAVTMSAHSKRTFLVSTRLTATSVRKVCNIASATADGSATKRSRACVKILKAIPKPRVPVTG